MQCVMVAGGADHSREGPHRHHRCSRRDRFPNPVANSHRCELHDCARAHRRCGAARRCTAGVASMCIARVHGNRCRARAHHHALRHRREPRACGVARLARGVPSVELARRPSDRGRVQRCARSRRCGEDGAAGSRSMPRAPRSGRRPRASCSGLSPRHRSRQLSGALFMLAPAAFAAIAVESIVVALSYRHDDVRPRPWLPELPEIALSLSIFGAVGAIVGVMANSSGGVDLLALLVPILLAPQVLAAPGRLEATESDAVTSLMRALEVKDPYTAAHSQRVARGTPRTSALSSRSRGSDSRISVSPRSCTTSASSWCRTGSSTRRDA